MRLSTRSAQKSVCQQLFLPIPPQSPSLVAHHNLLTLREQLSCALGHRLSDVLGSRAHILRRILRMLRRVFRHIARVLHRIFRHISRILHRISRHIARVLHRIPRQLAHALARALELRRPLLGQFEQQVVGLDDADVDLVLDHHRRAVRQEALEHFRRQARVEALQALGAVDLAQREEDGLLGLQEREDVRRRRPRAAVLLRAFGFRLGAGRHGLRARLRQHDGVRGARGDDLGDGREQERGVRGVAVPPRHRVPEELVDGEGDGRVEGEDDGGAVAGPEAAPAALGQDLAGDVWDRELVALRRRGAGVARRDQRRRLLPRHDVLDRRREELREAARHDAHAELFGHAQVLLVLLSLEQGLPDERVRQEEQERVRQALGHIRHAPGIECAYPSLVLIDLARRIPEIFVLGIGVLCGRTRFVLRPQLPLHLQSCDDQVERIEQALRRRRGQRACKRVSEGRERWADAGFPAHGWVLDDMIECERVLHGGFQLGQSCTSCRTVKDSIGRGEPTSCAL
nr:hypothetical protein CFP56_36151 [Quercus suber]